MQLTEYFVSSSRYILLVPIGHIVNKLYDMNNKNDPIVVETSIFYIAGKVELVLPVIFYFELVVPFLLVE